LHQRQVPADDLADVGLVSNAEIVQHRPNHISDHSALFFCQTHLALGDARSDSNSTHID